MPPAWALPIAIAKTAAAARRKVWVFIVFPLCESKRNAAHCTSLGATGQGGWNCKDGAETGFLR